MNKVAAFALRRKNSILSMSEKMFCPPQPLRFWITPACAGKRRSDWIIRSIYWDHPRMCGEKDKAKEMGATTKGSPPRMRGKVTTDEVLLHHSMITPAYAGKSCSSRRCCGCCWDHPCVCGEKIEMPYELLLKEGSPPRMRGKEAARYLDRARRRITPACAGKRGMRYKAMRSYRDHPRVCGEKLIGRLARLDGLGSPPRMRGKAEV